MATPCPASASASKAAIEQPEAELFLELLDLAGQRGLGDAQAQRRLRDNALLGDGDEGPQC